MIPLPSEFVQRIQNQHPQAHKIIEAFEDRASTSVRINPFKASSPLQNPLPWCEQGFTLETRPRFTLDPRFHAGAYYVQDSSCMLLEAVLQQICPQPQRILDLCAAPGGKSTHLASLYPQSLLIANEVIHSRVGILADNLSRWGHRQTWITQCDPQSWARRPEHFDLIVVDAPCSGEGLFRKDPRARSQWSLEHVQLCQARQERILKHAWELLAPGGTLIYSTCTYNPGENQAQLQALLSRGAEPLRWSLPDTWSVECFEIEGSTCLQTWPHQSTGEGFFLTAVQNPQNPQNTLHAPQAKRKSKRKKQTQHRAEESTESLIPWLNAELALQAQGQEVWAYPKSMNAWHSLPAFAPPLRLARLKGKTWVPHHHLAHSPYYSGIFPELHLDLEQSIAYLQGQSLEISAEHQGFVRLCYEGFALGWGKATQKRLNNLYPSPLRIRQSVSPQTLQENMQLLQQILPLTAL